MHQDSNKSNLVVAACCPLTKVIVVVNAINATMTKILLLCWMLVEKIFIFLTEHNLVCVLLLFRKEYLILIEYKC